MTFRQDDNICKEATFRDIGTLERVLEVVDDFGCCIQAGGNVGVWPKVLSAYFQNVYTFEPDPQNFLLMTQNVPEINVFKFPAALGNERKRISVEMDVPLNPGAYSVRGAGNIPTFMIDDLGLDSCGLICLDIEGFEAPALQGAEETIDKCSPVILIEEKGLGRRYGFENGSVGSFLNGFGYELSFADRRDLIFKRRK